MKKSASETIAYCLLPVLVYAVVFELAGSLLLMGKQVLLSDGPAPVKLWLMSRAGDAAALMTAVSMAAGFLVIFRQVRAEVTFSVPPRRRADITAAAALGAAALSLLLNVALSAGGGAVADPGASAAGSQAASVSMVPGLLVYGVLSPCVEETVFRGITFGRMLRCLHAGEASCGAEEAPCPGGEASCPVDKRDAADRRAVLTAAALSSLLFGLYHGNVVQGLYAFCMGIVFCLFLQLTESLAATAALHGVINAVVLLLSHTGVYGSLLHISWMVCLLGVALCCGAYVCRRTVPPARGHR